MKTKETQRLRLINFIMTYASDEIQTKKDTLRLAKMSNKELLKEVQRIKKYYIEEYDCHFLY
tara:strand:+ start:711 stop:896 length:186 start_codon:yes stop_codon:yes gene_type:complete